MHYWRASGQLPSSTAALCCGQGQGFAPAAVTNSLHLREKGAPATAQLIQILNKAKRRLVVVMFRFLVALGQEDVCVALPLKAINQPLIM